MGMRRQLLSSAAAADLLSDADDLLGRDGATSSAATALIASIGLSARSQQHQCELLCLQRDPTLELVLVEEALKLEHAEREAQLVGARQTL